MTLLIIVTLIWIPIGVYRSLAPRSPYEKTLYIICGAAGIIEGILLHMVL